MLLSYTLLVDSFARKLANGSNREETKFFVNAPSKNNQYVVK